MEHLFSNDKQQIVTHGNPDLCVNSVTGCSIERLDVQMPFDKLEERLHIPSLTIKFRNSQSRNAKVVGDEGIDVIRRIILINDNAYPLWMVGGRSRPCEYDVLVTDEAGSLVHGPFFNHLRFHVALGSRDKECMLLVEQSVKPLEFHVTLVHQIVSEGFNGKLIHGFGIVHPALCQVDKSGDAAPKIEQYMHLDCTFVVVEISPWAKLETAFDCAAVKGIYHLVNTKTVIILVIEFSCFFNEILCQVVVNAPVLLLVHLAKCGPGNDGQSSMVKLALECGQCCLISSQTLLRCQLGKAHDHELIATTELDHVPVAIISCDTLTEHVFWEKGHELGEYTLTFIHLIFTLCYYQTQSYNFKSSKKIFRRNTL